MISGGNPDGALRTAWAGGEDPPETTGRPQYGLYHVGIGFTVVHLAVLLVATMPVDAGGVLLGLPLLAVVALSLFALMDADRWPDAVHRPDTVRGTDATQRAGGVQRGDNT